MQLCCKCGGALWNQPLKITKCGHFKDSKWSRQKIETFRGARDFLALLNGTSDSEGHFGIVWSFGLVWKSQTSLQCEEIVKSTLFRKVRYVLYSGIKHHIYSSLSLQCVLKKRSSSIWVWAISIWCRKSTILRQYSIVKIEINPRNPQGQVFFFIEKLGRKVKGVPESWTRWSHIDCLQQQKKNNFLIKSTEKQDGSFYTSVSYIQ